MPVRRALGSVPTRLRALPPGKRLLAFAVVVGLLDLLVYALLVAALTLIDDGPADWTGPIGPVLGSFVGALLAQVLILWWRRRRAGEADRTARRPVDTAARTGRLPADADPATWAPLLEERREAQRQQTVVVVVVQAVFSVVLLTLVLLATDQSVLRVAVWALLALQVMSLTWGAGERRRRRLAGMLERLSARPAGRDGSRSDQSGGPRRST